MQKRADAPDLDECAVRGQRADATSKRSAHVDFRERLFLERVAPLFENDASGNDDGIGMPVEPNDANLELLPDERIR